MAEAHDLKSSALRERERERERERALEGHKKQMGVGESTQTLVQHASKPTIKLIANKTAFETGYINHTTAPVLLS